MFSIIIPLYNKARYIGATLASVLEQTYTAWEAIVVDDGSTDGSAEIVEKIVKELNANSNVGGAQGTPLIRLIRQPNGGVSCARNTGIRAAKGDFVAFLDADDRWDANYLEQMHALIQRHPQEGLFCAARHGRLIPYQPEETVIEDVAAWTIILWTGTIVARRTLFDSVGLFREGINRGEDRDMWLRIGLATPAVLLNRELAHYEEDAEGSLTATVPLSREFPYWEWYDLPTRFPDSLRRYATNQIIQLAKAHLQAGHRRTALRLMLRCRGTSDLRIRLKLLTRCLIGN